MSFPLALNSKKTNYEELFSVAQCAKIYYYFLYIFYFKLFFFG